MNTVAIAGVGLIGGSFGLALRAAGFAGEILGVSSPPALESAKRMGAISRGASLEEAAQHADLLYLAQPVDRILQTIELLAPLARPECLITDAGSTKTAIVTKAAQCLPSGNFLGGHPLAGKERSGTEAADAGLFRQRLYVLTPQASHPRETEFRSWLQRIGALIFDTTAEQHDAVVAFTSHLPQLLSTTLANTLASQHNANLTCIFGPGLLGMTRLALSPAEIWTSILATNRQNVLAALDAFSTSLTDTRMAIEKGELRFYSILRPSLYGISLVTLKRKYAK